MTHDKNDLLFQIFGKHKSEMHPLFIAFCASGQSIILSDWIVKSDQANVAILRFLFNMYSGYCSVTQRLMRFYCRCILWFVLRALELSLIKVTVKWTTKSQTTEWLIQNYRLRNRLVVGVLLQSFSAKKYEYGAIHISCKCFLFLSFLVHTQTHITTGRRQIL